MDPSHPALVLFCKEPRLGYGKQRLAAGIGKSGALQISRALIDCALEDAVAWQGHFILSPASDAELPWARALSLGSIFEQRNVRIVAQTEGNLGSRLTQVDARLRNMGATHIVFMGSDAPILNTTHFDTVRKALEESDVVLADGADGGVTLMASRCGWPDLEELPWSTDQLGDALTKSCRLTGRSVYRFDGGFDIDVEEDALCMIENLNGDQRPARKALGNLLRHEMCVTQ